MGGGAVIDYKAVATGWVVATRKKKTANRYLLRFDNLDIETRGSVVISPSGD